jgi:two-component system cell cycle sensor histidine kinase/response regulator CckA
MPRRKKAGEISARLEQPANRKDRSDAVPQPVIDAEVFAKTIAINPAAIAVIRLEDGLIMEMNASCLSIFGYSRKETIGRSAGSLNFWPTPETGLRTIEELRGKSGIRNRELTMIKRSGRPFVALLSADLVTVGGEQLIISTWQDITERKQAEEALRQSERNYREIFDNATDAIFIHDAQTGAILDVNDSMLQMFGLDREAAKALPANVTSLGVSPYSEKEAIQWLRKALTEGPQVFEWRARRTDGKLFWVEVALKSAEISGQRRILALVRDITERKRVEEELRENEARLKHAQKIADVGSWDWDVRSGALAWSEQTYRQMGEQPGNFAPNREDFPRHVHPEDQEMFVAAMDEALAGRIPFDLEFRIVRPNGEIRFLHSRGEVVRGSDGEPLRVLGVSMDITEQKRAEQSLKRSQESLAEAQRQTHVGSFEFDFQTGRLDWSEEMFRICGIGRADFKGQIRDFLDRLHPEDLQQVKKSREEALTRPGPIELEFRILRPNGDTRHVRMIFETFFGADGKPLRRIGTFQDITEAKMAEVERHRLEIQLQQAQKMESVGRLAGGVAHDFNNMLSVILGHVELALQQPDLAQQVHEDLLEILKAGRRSADLARQLLAFARRQTIVLKVLDLNETISGMLRMLERMIGENIVLHWQAEPNLWLVRMDPSQVDQILANLCVNARDAISGIGRITIETENCTHTDSKWTAQERCAPGEYVRLAVSDNGCGMDKETLSRIFEPFFTTKDVGSGTGLGLSTVYGVVKQNNGCINVESEPGLGTTFTIYLPRYVGEEERLRAEEAAAKVPSHGTILLVEDEPALLKMTAEMLKKQGHTVLAANSPGEAMRLAKQHRGEVHLLMTDVIMPEMNGGELAKNLSMLYPRLKCLFMSGYTADVIASHGMLEQGIYFLQKPFSMKELSSIVQKTFDRP